MYIEEWDQEDILEESLTYLNEMKANKRKLESFKDCYDAIKHFTNGYTHVIQVYKDAHKFMLSGLQQVVKSNSRDKLNKLILDYRDSEIKKINKAYENIWDTNETFYSDPESAGKAFRRLTSSFNIKYSDEVMKEKEKLSKELDDMENTVISKASPWTKITRKETTTDNSKCLELIELANKAKEIDVNLANTLGGDINRLHFFRKYS